MANVFPPGADHLLRGVLILGVGLIAAGIVTIGMLVRSPYATGQGRVVPQPVPFSHLHHVGDVGLDCRYCHGSVETEATAGLPDTATCMTCHSQLFTDAAALAPVRQSLALDRPLRWVRVNDLPDHVYFDHSMHVRNGVGCTTCHGPVGEMALTRQAAPLTMQWCLACHRDPAPHLRPPDAVFAPVAVPSVPPGQAARLMRHYGIRTAGLTDCTVCHR
ncbi:MAG: cytochrome c3 family protein [Sneathiellaceae bacterium]